MEILALYIIRLKCKLVKYVYYLLIIILVNKYLLLFTK